MLMKIGELINALEESHLECRMRNLEDDSPFETSFHAGQIHAYGVCLHLLRNFIKDYAIQAPVMPPELVQFMAQTEL